VVKVHGYDGMKKGFGRGYWKISRISSPPLIAINMLKGLLPGSGL
jgi:hypothetical protein